ncbi:MAG: PfkB family carbohydrate kinase [Candidatus Marinimicrobia bacterium]|jgi:rfaE bifunctional protein kinase chain/domain|nr:PfkB family carbohydrate kinase [Candidatus Neomarinimicrobiota bacterium]HCI16849.1 carbohydrate kinase [Candidatus Neomarinimicrobiota bacterium]|tara:strand:- start:16106 stop:18001 length:1896 start_codon:yes stop_codon:yes gene_type:complete
MKLDIQSILEKIQHIKVAVYGDLCLDAYWILDPNGSEISVETGEKGQAVREQNYRLGGASNIIANLVALKPAETIAIGSIGNDIFGQEIIRQFQELNVNTDGIVLNDAPFQTVTFCKRYLNQEEEPRIDFGFFNELTETASDRMLASIESALESSDALIINQQVPGCLDYSSFLKKLNQLLEKYPDKTVLMDSRDYLEKIQNVILKTNAVEAACLNGLDASPADTFSEENIIQFGQALFDKNQRPVFVSRGEFGLICVDEMGAKSIPGIHIVDQTDPVGAGDTMVSALACCLAAGLSSVEAAHFANLASVVTIKKRFQTGTASGEEILTLADDASFVFHPELADNIQNATFILDSSIEMCTKEIPDGIITHAVFDHDGTISILREGWETVMEPIMMNAILGETRSKQSDKFIENLRKRVLDFIDRTTGIQSILQMEGLADMVREYGLVPEDRILDKFGYKEIYNNALIDMVNERVEKLKKGDASVSDFTVNSAVDFLHKLSEKGVTLSLASGTDKDDVIAEAKLLGYADLFNGGIFGSVGDVSKYSKKKMIREIMESNDLHGHELVVFGDGPVEIKESRRVDGIAVGIASDEVSGEGLNPEKRTRLIRAGAHYVIPDFSESEALMYVLFKD